MATIEEMITFLQTDEFRTWLGGLKDFRALAVIFNRLDRATKGNFGDAKALGGGISEMRVDTGPGEGSRIDASRLEADGLLADGAVAEGHRCGWRDALCRPGRQCTAEAAA